MAEGLMRHYGEGRFNAFSAGSNPTGEVHPISLETLKAKGISAEGFYSKSWDELEHTNIDIVITVCDNAAGESCPVFLGNAVKAHFGVPDPAKFEGIEEEISKEFNRICEILERRIKALVELDINTLSDEELLNKLNEIANYD
jgi:arsenate reductase